MVPITGGSLVGHPFRTPVPSRGRAPGLFARPVPRLLPGGTTGTDHRLCVVRGLPDRDAKLFVCGEVHSHEGMLVSVPRQMPRQRRTISASTSTPPETLFVVDDDALVVFTDGSCLGNPGRGGWAWAVADGPFASGAESTSTNQRMEVRAVLEALRALDGDLVVASDSAYVVNCFKQRWWVGWQRRNWRNSQGAPVANQDLWEPLLALALDPSRSVRFRKVQGHSGDPMNDLVDRLAVEAATAGEGRSGSLGSA